MGYYSDALGNIHALNGESTISNLRKKFVAEVRFILSGEYESSFVQFFEVPELASEEHQNWSTHNLVSGTMEGKLMLMNEFIFLMYNSPDGRYSGVENLERVDDMHYRNHGFAFVNEQKMASWVMDWRRVK
jgi:hypothetical protein